MDAIIQRKRAKLAKQRAKIAEMEATAAAIEQEIQAAEGEQLGYLARSIANTLEGGMEQLFDILLDLRKNPAKANQYAANLPTIIEEKEGEVVDETNETAE